MLLHTGIIALLTGSLTVTAMLLYSSWVGVTVLRRWDINSSSEFQLALERRTYLVSTIMSFCLFFVILSMFLFIYTADDIHRMFVGAMCATGSLNANPVGWYVLVCKLAAFFLASLWIATNYIDRRCEDFPLVRLKFLMLLILTPVVATDTLLEFRYFLGLDPAIITSCCGSLFSSGGEGLAADLAGLPPRPMQYLFFVSAALYVALAAGGAWTGDGWIRYAAGAGSLIFFMIAVASIIAFISLYFYELPTHHCPFDILQAEYNFIGYPLYATLLFGSALGLAAGAAEILGRYVPDRAMTEEIQKRWFVLSALSTVIFVLIALWPMIFSTFTLEGY